MTVTICALTAIAVGYVAVADLVRAPFVLANSRAVGVPEAWLTALGLTKAAGALGLVVGLAGVPAVGALAAAALTLFFVGAVATHVRANDRALQFPLAYLALSAGSLVAFLVS